MTDDMDAGYWMMDTGYQIFNKNENI